MRKLVIFSAAFSISILLSVYLLPPVGIAVCAGICAVLSIGFVFLSGKMRTRYFISCIGLAVGFIYFFLHSFIFTYPAQQLFGTSSEISATVISYPKEYTAVVSLHRDGEFNVRTSLFCSSGFPQDAKPGDTVSAFAELTAPSSDSLYTSGVKLYASSDTVTITKGSGGIRYIGANIAHKVKTIIDTVFPDDTAAFAKALITGDKTDFYADKLLESSFQKTGLSHIVAVSGMHLSFALAVPRLFIKNRKRFSLISIPCILFFMAFAGFSPSVCRAGIMHLCVAAANLSRREPDEYTSLFTAVFVILLFDPYAAASISLQLSFSSVLGIMMFSSKIYSGLSAPILKLPKFPRYLLNTVINLFSASVGALVFTVPLSALHFGQVSIVAPVTSILVLCILSFTFVLCILACAAAMVYAPVGILTAHIASLPLRYIMWISRSLASLPFASVYTSNTLAVVWLVLTYALFLLLFIKKRPPRAYLTPVCMSVIALLIIMLIPSARSGNSSMELSVLSVGQGQCIVVTTDNMTAVIDCGSSGSEDAGEIAADYLHSRGITDIDYLILTHYHADHVNGVPDLISDIDTQTLIIPPLEEYTEYDDEIVAIAGDSGTNIIFINNDTVTALGSTLITVYPPLADSGENERCAAVLCSNGDYDVLITGDMPAYCEKLLLKHAALPDIEVFIAGHHGSAGSSCTELLETLKPETSIISVGDNNYGHPSEETLERFEKYGMIVLRTDESKHVILN